MTRACCNRAEALEQDEPGSGAHHWFNYGTVARKPAGILRRKLPFAAHEISPSLDRAWYGLGLVLIQLQRFDEAVAALKQNTKLQPMSPYGWYKLL